MITSCKIIVIDRENVKIDKFIINKTYGLWLS